MSYLYNQSDKRPIILNHTSPNPISVEFKSVIRVLQPHNTEGCKCTVDLIRDVDRLQ